jgi:hypothetical protein
MRKIRRSKQSGCGRKSCGTLPEKTFEPDKTKAQQNKLSSSKIIWAKTYSQKTQNSKAELAGNFLELDNKVSSAATRESPLSCLASNRPQEHRQRQVAWTDFQLTRTGTCSPARLKA